MEMKLNDNIILGRQTKDIYKTNLSTVNFKNAIKEISRQVISDFNVKTPNETTIATALSGGNQQKFVVGRELDDDPKVLIASQPTRGIDIGAQALIWDKLRETRDNGLGVLLVSADLEELIGLSDRIIVIYQGKICSKFRSTKYNTRRSGCLYDRFKTMNLRYRLISLSAPILALSLSVLLTSLILTAIEKTLLRHLS